MTNANINPENEDSISLSQAVNFLNSELNKLNKAYGKLKSAKPSITEARNKVDIHFTEVMRLLRKPVVRKAIEEVLAEYPDDTSEIREFLEPRPSDFIRNEVESVRPIKIDKKFLLRSIRSVLRKNETLALPYATVDEFYQAVEEVHQRILNDIEESRQLAKRKRNKKIRKVIEGSTVVTAGVALFVENATTATIPVVNLAAVLPIASSVLIGLNRVVSGCNTLIDNSSS